MIYDGNESGARLIGIEYIVSEKVFKTLPDDEKPLWHSHRHETTSGELVMPGIPGPVEKAAIATLVSTYGKTFHTWQIDRNSALPLGIPQLMMGFTQDGQIKPEILQARDTRLRISSADNRKDRADLASSAPSVQPGADGWSSGQVLPAQPEPCPTPEQAWLTTKAKVQKRLMPLRVNVGDDDGRRGEYYSRDLRRRRVRVRQ